MVKRVYKGIPLQLRGQAWALILDVETMKKENEGKYKVLKEELSDRLLQTQISERGNPLTLSPTRTLTFGFVRGRLEIKSPWFYTAIVSAFVCYY